MVEINGRKTIKCQGDVKVNVCGIKKDDILVLTIPAEYQNMDEYENMQEETRRLSMNLEKDLGFKVPVIILAGNVSFKTINRDVLLDIIND